jgi:hypothetical protein
MQAAVENATGETLVGPDLQLNTQIVDSINSNPQQCVPSLHSHHLKTIQVSARTFLGFSWLAWRCPLAALCCQPLRVLPPRPLSRAFL